MVLRISDDVYFDRSSGQYFKHKEFIVEKGTRFAEGLCPVKRREDGKMGYIDRSGRVAIAYRYDRADRFGDGRAWVQVGENCGLIDTAGCWVVEPGLYEHLYVCAEGRCAFSKGGSQWGFLDRHGTVAIPPVFWVVHEMALEFKEGLCLVRDKKGMVYIDRSGKVAIRLPEKVNHSYPFSDGMARVAVSVTLSDDNPLEWDKIGPRTLYGYIDHTGHIAIQPRFGTAGDFSEGVAPVTMTQDGSYEITRELISHWTLDPDFPEPPPRWGFIDKNGTVAIPFLYEGAGHFSEGLAAVKQNGRWGYVDRQGRMVIGAGFEYAKEFRNGVAEVVLADKIVYIDRQGRLIARTEFGGVPF